MTPDGWGQISRIYDAALEVAEAERPAFIREACQGDEDLRREVESLLAYDGQAQQFIDRPALQLTAEKLAAETLSFVGGKLGLIRFWVCWAPAEWEKCIGHEIRD